MEGTVSNIHRSTNIMAGLIMAAIVIWTVLEWLGIHIPFGA